MENNQEPRSAQSKKVAIIIVSWNGLKFLKDCFGSLFQQTYKNFEVYFVDNGSVDESVDFVHKNFPQVKTILLPKNYGFAKPNSIAINEALKDSEVRYVVTLNNDTKVDQNFIKYLVESAEKNDAIGCVAPKIRFFYEENLIDSIGILINKDGSGKNRGFKEIDNGQYDEPVEVFGACAGAALYKRELLESIKYKEDFFDSSFFAYYEDLDLAWRARLNGWKTLSCPKAVVYHVHSATGIAYSPFKAYYVNRNRFLLIAKMLPLKLLAGALLETPVRYMKLLNSMFFRKSGPSYKLKNNAGVLKPFWIVLKGWISVLFNIPVLVLKRRFIQKGRKVTEQEIDKWFVEYGASQEDMIYQ